MLKRRFVMFFLLAFVVVMISGCDMLEEGLGQINYVLNVRILPCGNGVVNISPNQSSYAAGTTVQLSAVPLNNWSFSHWEGDAAGSGPSVTVTMNDHKNVTAVFTRDDFDLNIETVGNGNVQVEVLCTPSDAYPYETILKVKAIPDCGHVFTRWELDLTGTENPTFLQMDGEKSIRAVFNREGEEGDTGVLKGRVRDALNNNPIEGVQVKVFNNNDQLVAQGVTDEDGDYAFSLPVGSNYYVEFSHDDYLPAVYRNINVTPESVIHLATVLQIDEEHAGDGTVSGVITNAIDGQGVAGLTLKLREGMNTVAGPVVAQTETGSGGAYSISNLPAGQYTAEITGEGYIDDFFTIVCIGGAERGNQNYSVTPILGEGETRIVLTWGETPRDLDSHLTGPKVPEDDPEGRFHVYFGNRRYIYGEVTYADLDRDDTSSYGPETITIYQQISGMYRYSVHNYTNRSSTSSTALAESGARVEVYQGATQVATFHVPSEEGTLWTVFELAGTTITPVNEMSYQSSPGSVQSLVEKVYE